MARSQQIPFRQTLVPLQGVRLFEIVHFDSVLTEVLMHWPRNCNGLVDIAMGVGNQQVYPDQGFLALDDASPIFRDNPVEVKTGSRVWVEWQNHDGANPHTPSVAVTLVEKVK